MGGSGEEGIGCGLWALGFWARLLLNRPTWQAGFWLRRGSGSLESKCTRGTCGHVHVLPRLRLGPLSVGLAAKSQPGKANLATCTRQPWELSKEPSTAGRHGHLVCKPEMSGIIISPLWRSPSTAGTASTRPHTCLQ